MKKAILAFLCILGFTQCNNKVYSLQNLPKKFIEIGSFGGFTGASETFHLFPNGQRILENTLTGDPKELTKADPKSFRTLLSGLKDMDFKTLELNSPGNLNYFIRLKTKKIDKKLLWSDMATAPEAVTKFYQSTMKLIKSDTLK